MIFEIVGSSVGAINNNGVGPEFETWEVYCVVSSQIYSSYKLCNWLCPKQIPMYGEKK